MIRSRHETKSHQTTEENNPTRIYRNAGQLRQKLHPQKTSQLFFTETLFDPYPPTLNRSNRLATKLAILAESARASLRPHTTHTSTSGNVIIASAISTVTIIAISGASPPSCRARM